MANMSTGLRTYQPIPTLKSLQNGSDDFIREWALCLISAFAAFFINALAMDATFAIQAIVFYTLLAMMTILWLLNTRTKNLVCAESKRAF